MYTCKEISKLLDLYTDGELDEQRRLLAETHLQGCHLCSRLVRLREEEARLIRSDDPVPALSPGFTRQVMASLGPVMRSPAQGQWLFSLRKSLARPWLAPALAGLVLLAAVSYAASLHLITASPKQVALQNSQSGSQAQPQLTLPGSMTFSAEGGKAASDNSSLNKQELTGAVAPKTPADSGEADRVASSRNVTPVAQAISPTNATSPTVDGASDAQTPAAGSMPDTGTPVPPLLSLAPRQNSLEALEQQGYTVFQPGYLPSGYTFDHYSLLPGGSDSAQNTDPLTGKEHILLSYRNIMSGALLTLEIQALANPAPPPQIVSNANATGSQQTGANRIARQIQKLGHYFMLQVTGTISPDELQIVADSVSAY
ncbi:MAG: zf-HC2 domain-containing protein [Thermacetogeniaceae bacterium]